MAIKQNLIPILIDVTYWTIDSIIDNKHDKYIDIQTHFAYDINNLSKADINYLGNSKYRSYYNVNKPILTIDIISSVFNNRRIDKDNIDYKEELLSTIYLNNKRPNTNKFIKDIENEFDMKYINKNGKECCRFTAIFEEWYAQYHDDCDYGLTYIKLLDINKILNSKDFVY